MVPLLVALGLPGIGALPAFLGLTLYSLLPMLRNTVTGLSGIDPAVIEAARGVGMTRAQRLRRVELPLALPTIVAGVRTSAVWTVGMATLSTPVGAPSLGNFIFSGLQTREPRRDPRRLRLCGGARPHARRARAGGLAGSRRAGARGSGAPGSPGWACSPRGRSGRC
ncbi:MAG: ABC transporter permease [Comamonadaceae bacterium]|nr:ABC transporter permease [Comamonadaceae bacterium]